MEHAANLVIFLICDTILIQFIIDDLVHFVAFATTRNTVVDDLGGGDGICIILFLNLTNILISFLYLLNIFKEILFYK